MDKEFRGKKLMLNKIINKCKYYNYFPNKTAKIKILIIYEVLAREWGNWQAQSLRREICQYLCIQNEHAL